MTTMIAGTAGLTAALLLAAATLIVSPRETTATPAFTTREVEADILDTCEELGIGFVAYGALGRGLLTGNIATDTALAPVCSHAFCT